MLRDSNNNIEGFERLLKKYTPQFMYNLILPLETCQQLFKRCSLRNMKFTSDNYQTHVLHNCWTTNSFGIPGLYNGTSFAENYQEKVKITTIQQ